MPTLLDEGAKESRTRSVGIKRSLASLDDTTTGPESKKLKRSEAFNRTRKQIAQPIGEKYGFDSEEYRFHLLDKKGRTVFNKRRRLAGLRAFNLNSSEFAALKATRPSDEMDSSSSKDRTGPNAWNHGSSSTIRTSLRGKVAPIDESKLGNNRLATGFASTSAAAAPSPDSLESGETRSTPIEISSDEDEGGMVLNVEGQAAPDVVSPGSDGYDDSDEEIGGDRTQVNISTSVSFPHDRDLDAHMQLQGELERHLSNDFEPLSINKRPLVRLADLSRDELEQQYKYCFYGLERDQIDMARPAICLECLQDGHIEKTCPEKYCQHCDNENTHTRRECPKFRRCTKCRERGHDSATCQSKLMQDVVCEHCGSKHHVETKCDLRFFPPVNPSNNSNIRLWVSCCRCASKTHLVGDCPSLHPDDGPRWSLRALDPAQIINLSLQTGISGLEKAAENRNMRPQGRNIRPGFVNQRKTFDSDSNSNESFLRAPVSRQNPNQKGSISFAPPPLRNSTNERYPLRSNPEREGRYDRYDAPSSSSTGNNRNRGGAGGGGDWYSTDSFGQERQRRRSRSPEQAYRRDFGGVDSYRPPGPDYSGQGRNWQPPLPPGPPPGQSYRPGAGLPPRPPPPQQNAHQGHGQGRGQGQWQERYR